MTRIHQGLFALAVLTGILLGAGCGPRTPPTQPPDTRSKVDYFRDRQGGMETPHGRIKKESIREVNGKIQYETEDGQTWQVEMTRNADGTYTYGTPEEVE